MGGGERGLCSSVSVFMCVMDDVLTGLSPPPLHSSDMRVVCRDSNGCVSVLSLTAPGLETTAQWKALRPGSQPSPSRTPSCSTQVTPHTHTHTRHRFHSLLEVGQGSLKSDNMNSEVHRFYYKKQYFIKKNYLSCYNAVSPR